MKNSKFLYYLSVFFIFAGIGLLVASMVLSFVNMKDLSSIFLLASSISGLIGCILIVLYNIFIVGKNVEVSRTHYTSKTVRTVDVKDLPKSRQETLYEEYENLYKGGLITKEDLDKKKEELLGK